LVGTNWLC